MLVQKVEVISVPLKKVWVATPSHLTKLRWHPNVCSWGVRIPSSLPRGWRCPSTSLPSCVTSRSQLSSLSSTTGIQHHFSRKDSSIYYLSICLFVYLSFYPSFYLCIYLSTMEVLWEQSIHLSTYRFWKQLGENHLSVHLSILGVIEIRQFKRLDVSLNYLPVSTKHKDDIFISLQCDMPHLQAVHVASLSCRGWRWHPTSLKRG